MLRGVLLNSARAVVAASVLWLVGCASTPPGSLPMPAPGPDRSATPAPAPEKDGPPDSPPPNLAEVPDAEPRVEPIKPGGPNKPYEVAGQRYEPSAADVPLTQRGLASWYGRKFHGRPTASGERYDMYAMTAAHPTLPIPSYARVRNPANGREVVVRINDRGPFHSSRIIDLSYTAALKLDLLRGVAMVEVERLTHEAIRTGAWRQGAPAPTVAAAPATASTATTASSPSPPGTATSTASTNPVEPMARVVATELPVTAGAPAEAMPPVTSEAGAAVAANLPAAEVAPAPARGFWVQLGAFRQRDGADRLHRRLALDLSWLAPLLGVFSDQHLLRVQAGPYTSRDEAQRVAQRVRAAAAMSPLVTERR